MYLKSKFNFKKFLVAMLSMLMAVMLALSVACSDGDDPNDPDDDDGDTTTTTAIDHQVLKNGDFEYGWTEKTTFPLSSSINWSKSMGSDVTIAPSSKGSSGVIDTGDKFESLTSKNKPSENPSTPYDKGLIATNDYDKDDDEKKVNPNVAGKKVLMINNQNNGMGTAQSYKATSSISVAVDEFAILSFWIKTANLSSFYTQNPGAYVKIGSNNGSAPYDDFYIRGINTKGEWAQFNIGLKGSSLNTTTVNLTIGLGEGNGTDQNGFVEGFTFIDNVCVKTVNEADYDSTSLTEIEATNSGKDTVVTLPTTYVYKDNELTSTVITDKYSVISYKLNFDKEFATTALSGSVQFSTTKHGYDYTGAGANKIGVGNLATTKAIIPSAFGENDHFDSLTTNFTYMNFVKHSSANFVTTPVSISAGGYKYVTFFAKVNASNANSDKLTIDVIDKNGDIADQDVSLFASFDTSALESERYNDWIKYQAFINNPTNLSTSFELKFTFGSDKDFSDAYALQTGYAIIADLKVADADETSYNKSTTSAQLVKKQVYGEYISYSKVTEDETGDDVYGISVDKTQTFTLKEVPATNVIGYNFKSDKSTTDYGIINSKYYNETTNVYGSSTTFSNNLVGLSGLNNVGNEYAQVVIMDNKELAYSRFVTTTHTVSAETVSKITVKVKAYGSAVANVSLVTSSLDAEELEYQVIDFKVGEFTQKLSSKITATSYQKDGWTTVHYYVQAGNEDVTLRVMVSNGSKQTASQGVVLFEGVTFTTVDSAKVQADKSALKLNFTQYANSLSDATLKPEYAFTSKMDTRKPSTVKSDGEDGEVIETIQYYNPTEVFLGNEYAKFVSYETINADDVIDNTTPSTDNDSSTDTPTDEGYSVSLDVTLQISSIIIAVVLIAVMITILIRNGLKKRAKRKAKTQSYYEENSGFDRNTREKTLKKIAEKKAKIALASDDEEYDYNAAQEVNEDAEVETVEEVVEETAEDVLEETSEEENVETEEVVEETTETESDNANE